MSRDRVRGRELSESGEGRSGPVVSSGRRAVAARVLRERAKFDARTLIAVVDAAAWWLDQEAGASYAAALLAAVTDDQTADDALSVLLATDLTGGVPRLDSSR